MADLSITTGLREIARRLVDAAAIAKAAVAATLHGAMCLLGRMKRAASLPG